MRTPPPYAVNRPTVHQSDIGPAWWTPPLVGLIPMDTPELDDAMEAEADDLLVAVRVTPTRFRIL